MSLWVALVHSNLPESALGKHRLRCQRAKVNSDRKGDGCNASGAIDKSVPKKKKKYSRNSQKRTGPQHKGTCPQAYPNRDRDREDVLEKEVE